MTQNSPRFKATHIAKSLKKSQSNGPFFRQPGLETTSKIKNTDQLIEIL